MGGQVPWLRAYSSVLNTYNITPELFMAFLDNLTIAQAASPALQALNIASMGIGAVPDPVNQVTGFVLGVAAGVGTEVASRTRTKEYLAEVNKVFFSVRGLRVRVVPDEEVRGIVGSHGLQPLPYRRLRALTEAGYIAPLTFDVPPPQLQSSRLDRISAKQIDSSLARKTKRANRKMRSQEEDERIWKEGGLEVDVDGVGLRKREKDLAKRWEKDCKKVRKLKWVVVEEVGKGEEGSASGRG
ncbi:hypothetical protein K402DRAFT_333688 [Aulographum hederae CBS 113979]|uniref:Uncharacterized protein n=1 Tax=Aulographum hederae CBS 113979 TaxID=1176131 RepID=A0A6G1GYE1_9PEZI|nr:hypothetical protein K402DRAFT_333688 [Aulographum hederae CBS 113979]